jgi:hypothetical protein
LEEQEKLREEREREHTTQMEAMQAKMKEIERKERETKLREDADAEDEVLLETAKKEATSSEGGAKPSQGRAKSATQVKEATSSGGAAKPSGGKAKGVTPVKSAQEPKVPSWAAKNAKSSTTTASGASSQAKAAKKVVLREDADEPGQGESDEGKGALSQPHLSSRFRSDSQELFQKLTQPPFEEDQRGGAAKASWRKANSATPAKSAEEPKVPSSAAKSAKSRLAAAKNSAKPSTATASGASSVLRRQKQWLQGHGCLSSLFEEDQRSYVLEEDQPQDQRSDVRGGCGSHSCITYANQGHNALTLAAAAGDTTTIWEAAMGNIDHQILSGQSALMLAAYLGHVSFVQMLITRGADLELKDACGHTALMLAAGRGHTGIVVLLSKAGANRLAVDIFGKGVADWASCVDRSIYNMLQKTARLAGYSVETRLNSPALFACPRSDVLSERSDVVLSERSDVANFNKISRQMCARVLPAKNYQETLHDWELHGRKRSICQELGFSALSVHPNGGGAWGANLTKTK